MSAETQVEAAEESTESETTEAESPTKFIVESGTLTTFLDTVNAVVDECIVRFDDDGLSVTAQGPAQASMVSAEFSAESMESYKTGGGRIGISIGRLQDIADLAEAGELLTLSLNSETRCLEISGDGFEYEYATIDPRSIRAEPDIPELDLPSEFVIDPDDLSRVQSGVGMLNDYIRFSTETEGAPLCVEAKGDTDSIRFEMAEDQLESIESIADVESMFSLDYVEPMVSEMTGPVVTHLGNEMPVVWEYESPSGSVMFMVAPQIAR
jgi:proliferating cell nuclear antigen